MLNAFRVLAKNRYQPAQPTEPSGGFTLIELLVSLILGALVLTPLLYFMVNILTSERREQAKAITEQELQAAVDYITRDLEQAVYIYDEDALTNTAGDSGDLGIRDEIPPKANEVEGCTEDNCTPVLAFWKREVYDKAFRFDNTACGVGVNTAECNDAFAYSLVVYYLVDEPDGIWSDTKRIARFELNGGVPDPEVVDPDPTDSDDYFVSPTTGYAPFELKATRSLDKTMNIWQKGRDDYNTPALVLVDHIDLFNLDAVSITTNTAQVSIRANALSRNPALSPVEGDVNLFRNDLASFFPSTTIQVQGLGKLN